MSIVGCTLPLNAFHTPFPECLYMLRDKVLVLNAWLNIRFASGVVSLGFDEAVVICQVGDLYGAVSPAAHVGSSSLSRLSHDGG